MQNNVYGISGVAPNCHILPVRINGGNSFYSPYCAQAIAWAANNGADVISCS